MLCCYLLLGGTPIRLTVLSLTSNIDDVRLFFKLPPPVQMHTPPHMVNREGPWEVTDDMNGTLHMDNIDDMELPWDEFSIFNGIDAVIIDIESNDVTAILPGMPPGNHTLMIHDSNVGYAFVV